MTPDASSQRQQPGCTDAGVVITRRADSSNLTVSDMTAPSVRTRLARRWVVPAPRLGSYDESIDHGPKETLNSSAR